MAHIQRRIILFALAALAQSSWLLAQDSVQPDHQPPNVLFIAIDDLRPSLGCYGDPLAVTPNIDQFAKTARRFNHAYVQQAVCGPSRTSLLTGLLPDHTRVWHNRNRFRDTVAHHVTLPQLFKNQGYDAAALGKIFSGSETELDPISWSRPEILQQTGWKNYLLAENQGKGKQAAWEAADVADNAYTDGKLAELAIETLEDRAKKQAPFFLAVGFFKPHLPFNAPKKYWDLHDPNSFDLPDALRQDVGDSTEFAAHSHRELGGYRDVRKDEQLDTDQTRHLRHGYYACVSYTDAQVGKLLAALSRLNLDRNTIVVIWGDHGFSLGETNRWCKGTNFELDTRVPLLIRTPDMKQPGIASNSIIEMVDLYPTLAELAGLAIPRNLDGRSFVPILADPQAPGRALALSQFNRPWKDTTPEVMGYSIRTPTHRYTRWIKWNSRQTIAEELYDYSSPMSTATSGPHRIEHQNIAAKDPDLLSQMSGQMDEVLDSRIRSSNRATFSKPTE